MHPTELTKTLSTMTILCDTREQDTDLAHQRYEAFGVPVRREKLNFGDYSAEFLLSDGSVFTLQDRVCVERKMNADELCACYTRERERFTREFERAKQAGAKIYLLVEKASWEMFYGGRYRSQMSPASLVSSVLAWLARYNCQILMCKAETTGRLIHDILYREAREMLEKL